MFKIKYTPEDFKVKEIMNLDLKRDGNYVYLILEKKNISTLDAIKIIAKHFQMPVSEIGFAGLKDKVALTKQHISIPSRFYTLEKYTSFEKPKIKLEFVGRGDSFIHIGSNIKNEFEIVVRNVPLLMREDIYLEQTINYFDEQRFSINNIQIGRLLLKKNFSEAVKLIMKDKKYSKLLQKHLQTIKNDYIGALRHIEKNILRMYVHAYQSNLWNRIVCEYLKIKYPDHYIQSYSAGEFCFPREKPEDLELPIPGFDLRSSLIKDKLLLNIYEKILLEEKIMPRDFIIRELPEITCEGGTRNLILKIYNFASSINDDEVYKGMKKIKFKFTLEKGGYATIVVRNAMLIVSEIISSI